MDLQPFIDGALAFGAGAVVWKILDAFFVKIIARHFPEKYIIRIIRNIDDNIIDKIKEKNPKSGKEIESRIKGILERAIRIVDDKE